MFSYSIMHNSLSEYAHQDPDSIGTACFQAETRSFNLKTGVTCWFHEVQVQ